MLRMKNITFMQHLYNNYSTKKKREKCVFSLFRALW